MRECAGVYEVSLVFVARAVCGAVEDAEFLVGVVEFADSGGDLGDSLFVVYHRGRRRGGGISTRAALC